MSKGSRISSRSNGVASSSTKTTEIGSVLADRYEVTRELGRGGMGLVYLCRDRVTEDDVALKRLRRPEEVKGTPRPEEGWWFHQEARAVASLDHPSIVRARDFGTLVDGTPYLVMDVLPGRSIHEWMHTTTMAWADMWSLVDQVLAGLAHAHARGIIHGDLKPSNVMFERRARGGSRAYILDLGLAWLREHRHDPRLDGANLPAIAKHSGAGTVGWVAPEQIRKAATLVGAPTDIYALGCIIYRILTGKEVFEGDAQEVLRAHKRTPIPPPVLRPGIPERVGPFVQRMLAKRPWHRFEFAADARHAWNQFKPPRVKSLEQLMAVRPSLKRTSATRGASVAKEIYPASRSLAPGLLALRPSPMVARETERRELLQVVEDVCVGKGPPQRMVVLVGEAGVGKSRLAEWLCEQVHEQGWMHPLRARYGRIATPLDGITAAINAHFHLDGADRSLVEQTLMARWEVSPGDDEALTWVAATAEWLRPTAPGGIAPLGPTGKRFVLDRPELRWMVVRKVLERMGRDRPVLLSLDDLHLSSRNTFDMLAHLHSGSPTLRLLIVATARSEALASDLDAALRLESIRADWDGRVVELRPLTSDETEVLLRATLPLQTQAVAHAVDQSSGNPLFALQLLHAWAGGGYLTMEGGQYGVRRDALRGRAITTSELWDERLRAVTTDLRLAAYAAAALGEDIRGEIFKPLMTSLGIKPQDALVALSRAQILLATGPDQFRWAHTLLQEHLLERLQDRSDAAAIFRLAAAALARHPSVGSRRIMKHRVTNLLRAGDDDVAAELMFRFIDASWRRGRDTTATLRDLELLAGRLVGPAAAEHCYWNAEAMRHVGRLLEAREYAERAYRAFKDEKQKAREAHTLRLLGHISSDLGDPIRGRQQVVQALEVLDKLGDVPGCVQAQVVLGEINYLLGDHATARDILLDACARCVAVDDPLGRAQCLLLLALTRMARGDSAGMRELIAEARLEFDALGYRLGLAQCEIVLARTEYRASEMDRAFQRTNVAMGTVRELQNPRGEAACERLLALIAFDADDFESAQARAHAALALYTRLQDPCGELEARLVLAQIALATNESDAGKALAECDAVRIEEAEPKQHRYLTRAWFAQNNMDSDGAAEAIEAARECFSDRVRCGDHTPKLLERFAKLGWRGAALTAITRWRQALGNHSLSIPPIASTRLPKAKARPTTARRPRAL